MTNLQSTPTDVVPLPYLEGIFAPIVTELTTECLPVIGNVPDDLVGIFVQNGPNPAHRPLLGHSWFDGDGMVHGVRLRDGTASYRNRYVRTSGLEEDRQTGSASYLGSLAGPGAGPRHKNVANTDVVFHAGRLLSLWWEGGEPYELSVPDLETIGVCDLGGTLAMGMTSHVKVDPATNELFFFDWGRRAPYLRIGVVGADGRFARSMPVELPGHRVQHDLAITDTYVVVFDLPMSIDPARATSPTLGFVFDGDAPCRIGLVDRSMTDPTTRWFEVAPCWVWHTLCAWDEGDEVVLWAARIGSPTRVDKWGRSLEDLPMVDDEYRFDSHPHEWRLNLRTGTVRERQIDDALVEFPRVNDANVSSGARYGYFAELGINHRTLKAEAILKYDLITGQRTTIAMPPGWYANEPCFAPRPNGTSEDDGWLLTYVTEEASERSELWVLDAATFTAEPLARIVLPQRKPQGFHTRWLPSSAIGL